MHYSVHFVLDGKQPINVGFYYFKSIKSYKCSLCHKRVLSYLYITLYTLYVTITIAVEYTLDHLYRIYRIPLVIIFTKNGCAWVVLKKKLSSMWIMATTINNIINLVVKWKIRENIKRNVFHNSKTDARGRCLNFEKLAFDLLNLISTTSLPVL